MTPISQVFKYQIVVFNDEVDDHEFTLVSARDNFYQPISNNQSIVLTEVEVNSMFKVFNIINEVNDSMIGIHEDDIIYSNDIIKQCVFRLETYINNQSLESREEELSNKILELFKDAYKRNKNIYFLF